MDYAKLHHEGAPKALTNGVSLSAKIRLGTREASIPDLRINEPLILQ